jgi:hypothetical protein
MCCTWPPRRTKAENSPWPQTEFRVETAIRLSKSRSESPLALRRSAKSLRVPNQVARKTTFGPTATTPASSTSEFSFNGSVSANSRCRSLALSHTLCCLCLEKHSSPSVACPGLTASRVSSNEPSNRMGTISLALAATGQLRTWQASKRCITVRQNGRHLGLVAQDS